MRYSHTLLEEELKNRVGEDFFADFNHSTIKGRVDFCIADKQSEPQARKLKTHQHTAWKFTQNFYYFLAVCQLV